MAIFHLFTVHLDEYADHEVPQVRIGDYIVQAKSMAAAVTELRFDYGKVDTASEIWGYRRTSATSVLASPSNVRDRRESLHQHQHWARVQGVYKLVHQGAKSLDQLKDEHFAKRYPQHAAADRAIAAGATPGDSVPGVSTRDLVEAQARARA
jgi:hypothetical protein